MIKAIIFDFDGVILESTDIKTDAFRELFSEHLEHIEAIMNYHLTHMGISRYKKFEYFYKEFLKLPYSDEEGEALGEKFSAIVMDKILNAAFVDGAESFIKDNYQKYLFFIATGTPHEEIQVIVDKRCLRPYFKSVMGTPSSKSDISKLLLETYNLLPQEVLFVGDAAADLQAANENGLFFYGRKTKDNEGIFADLEYCYKDLTELANVIKLIDKGETI